MHRWRASSPRSKQSGSMRPSSARARRRGRQSSSTSRYFTIGSACTRPWDTEPRPRLAPAWRRSPCERRPDILIYPLHSKGGGPPFEALNSKLRRAVRARGHFPTDEAALKLLFLVLNRSEKEWTMPAREWCMAKAQFAILFGERFTRALA